MVRCDINLVFWHVIYVVTAWLARRSPCASNRGSLINYTRARAPARESAAKHSARMRSEGYGI